MTTSSDASDSLSQFRMLIMRRGTLFAVRRTFNQSIQLVSRRSIREAQPISVYAGVRLVIGHRPLVVQWTRQSITVNNKRLGPSSEGLHTHCFGPANEEAWRRDARGGRGGENTLTTVYWRTREKKREGWGGVWVMGVARVEQYIKTRRYGKIKALKK